MKNWPRFSRLRWFTQATTPDSELPPRGLRARPVLYLLTGALALLTGCSALLPSGQEETVASWKKFEEAKAAYDKITLGSSRDELKELGFDVDHSPNIQVLSYLDVADKVDAIPMTQLDPGLQECLQRRDECQSYVLDLRHLRSKRVGGFWADFFNFRRTTDATGWRFNALLVIIDDQVTYKLWSGTPKIDLYEQKRNPLGPLQSFSDMTLGLLPW